MTISTVLGAIGLVLTFIFCYWQDREYENIAKKYRVNHIFHRGGAGLFGFFDKSSPEYTEEIDKEISRKAFPLRIIATVLVVVTAVSIISTK
jgi:hypothetical protein